MEIRGKVIDSISNAPLSGVKVTLGNNNSTSNNQGSYLLDVDEDNNESTTLLFTKPKYNPQSIPATKLDGKLKSSINVVKLDTIKKSLDKEVSGIQVLDENVVNELKGYSMSSPEGVAVEVINKEANKLLTRAIPFGLNILAQYGITNVNDLSNKTCQSLPNISESITQKNKLTKQLNNSYKSITSLKSAGKILEAIITAFTIIYQLLTKNPTPTALGVPPSPAGGVFPPPLTKTVGQMSSYDEKREDIKRLLDKLKGITESFTPAAIPMASALAKLTGILRGVDTCIGDCLDNARQLVVDEVNKQNQGDVFGAISGSNVGIGVGTNGSNISGGGLNSTDAQAAGITTIDNFDFTTISEQELRNLLGIDPNADFSVQDLLAGDYLQEQLDSELLALTEESAQDGEPSVTEYNGFILSVETESEEAAQGKSIKRRFAVAKNSDGITLLKGEKSYSSNDQILIDELIFKIESEGLTVN